MRANYRKGAARFPFGPRLAETDNCWQTSPEGGGGFFADALIALIMTEPPLGMAENHIGGARILQHFSGNVSGKRAVWLAVTMLAAKRDLRPLANQPGSHEQGCRRTNKSFRLSS